MVPSRSLETSSLPGYIVVREPTDCVQDFKFSVNPFPSGTLESNLREAGVGYTLQRIRQGCEEELIDLGIKRLR